MIEGLDILLLEDEYLIALDAEDTLTGLGAARVAIASNLEQAETLAASRRFDLAILDVNINGRMSFDLAKGLSVRGVPVVFASGYELAARPEGVRGAVCLTKPYSREQLTTAIAKALKSA